MPILCSIEPQTTPLRAPTEPSALTRNFGTTNSDTPLMPAGAPSTRASTRGMMLGARSCSPAEMNILVPVILKLPSACRTALVRSRPRSVPQCGSVRFMVPVHSPDTIFGRNMLFCSSLPCTTSAAVAPMVRPPYIENAMLAEHWNSDTVCDSVTGSPWPPYSTGDDRPSQPPSVTCLNASLKPFGVVTLPSSWRGGAPVIPKQYSGGGAPSVGAGGRARR